MIHAVEPQEINPVRQKQEALDAEHHQAKQPPAQESDVGHRVLELAHVAQTREVHVVDPKSAAQEPHKTEKAQRLKEPNKSPKETGRTRSIVSTR